MSNLFDDFLRASEEVDDLALEGFFGEEIKNLVKKRDSMSTSEYFYSCLLSWNSDESQYGKDKVKEFILLFFTLYTRSIKSNGQKTIDYLTIFWKGTKENPELECLSASTEFARLHQETLNTLKELKSKNKITISDRKRLASSIINTYSKGVEFIGKILTTCIVLEKVSKNEPFDLISIYKMTVFEKIKLFNKLSNNEFKNMTNLINRYLRNADSHLSLIFDYKMNVIILKKVKRDKIQNETIPIEKMILEIFPSNGWITQAFIYSGMLLVLSRDNQDLFNKAISEIYNIDY